jgi:hypothetical protein
MYWATGVPGWARFGWGGMPAMQTPNLQTEKEMLQAQAEAMQSQLEEIRKRLEQLEREEATKGQ